MGGHLDSTLGKVQRMRFVSPDAVWNGILHLNQDCLSGLDVDEVLPFLIKEITMVKKKNVCSNSSVQLSVSHLPTQNLLAL